MNKLFIMAGLPTLAISAAAADIPDPKVVANSNAYFMSASAQYMVSDGYVGLQIFDLSSGQSYDYTEGSPDGHYESALGKCISDNGIVLSNSASYWKDGKWHRIKVPANYRNTNLVNSITTDGRRVCGSLGMADMSTENSDLLRQAPCIWNWDESKGAFGDPVMLPYPSHDFTGRVPQIVSAIDISGDGKTIVGQVQTSVGNCQYPIIYHEGADGNWSYELPNHDALYPEGFVFPEYPGDEGPTIPSQESYMTEEEINAYLDAFDAYINSGYTLPAPSYEEFMTPEEIEEYNKAMVDYNAVNEVWSEKFMTWLSAYYTITSSIPNYQFNSMRISSDGKTYANTVLVNNEEDPLAGFMQDSHIYVYDIESGALTKYEQRNDFVLTYLADGGKALAVSNLTSEPQSYVLEGGECTDMLTYITGIIPEYDSWMKENMVQSIEVSEYNEELGEDEIVFIEMVLTGRASATPDLSVIILGVTNVWDYLDEGNSYVFDMKYGDGVASIRPDGKENLIYDLNGRRLNKAENPGLYIINGEKKIIR